MKKILFTVLISIFLFDCHAQVFNEEWHSQKLTIKIERIDSTNDYYLLYAMDSSGVRYKIVTRKLLNDKMNIIVGRQMEVTLQSINQNLPNRIKESNMPCDWSYGFPNNNIITLECDYGCDLYFVKEFFGLYYTQNIDEIKYYRMWEANNPLPWNHKSGQHIHNNKDQ